MVKAGMRYRRIVGETVTSTIVGDESVVWNADLKQVSMLNETASYILGVCDGETEAAIVALLTDSYQVSEADARVYVAECLQTLLRLCLVRQECD